MAYPRVILIGGAPNMGKTTTAIHMAGEMGRICLSTDDIGMAVRAVASTETHPDLHPVAGQDYHTYYKTHLPAELVDRANRSDSALWPAIRAIIHAHAEWREPAVIEGWGLRPEWVAAINLPEVASVWLVGDEETVKQRLLGDAGFIEWVAGEELVAEHTVEQNVLFNRMLAESADRLHLPLIDVSGKVSPSEVLQRCLERLMTT
jgi:2-phosphoglycerate kinase